VRAPDYVQLDFFVDALKAAVRADADVSATPEFAAVLSGDRVAVGELGLERIALALTSLFEGISPEEFTHRVRTFMRSATHPVSGRPLASNVYQPMIELIEELGRREVRISLVTGGAPSSSARSARRSTASLRRPSSARSSTTTSARGHDGAPRLLRSGRPVGLANEGTAKVSNIQSQLGRRPLTAAGNSGGDREMLEWAAAGPGPTLALLVDHDDAEREFAYVSTAETVAEPEPITSVGARLAWTVVSMAADRETVFPPRAAGP
jgi:hypothetical protein